MGIIVITVLVSLLYQTVGIVQVILVSILIRAEVPLGKLVDVEPVVTAEQVLDYLVVLGTVPAEVVSERAFQYGAETLGHLTGDVDVVLVRASLLQDVLGA